MKKLLLAILIAAVLCLAASAALAADLKVGVILIGDATEGYTLAHMNGISAAAANVGIAEDQIIWKYKIPEDQTCYDNAVDLVGQGCNLIIANSFGHQTFMDLAAEEFPDVTFVSMTGNFAAISGKPNLKNGFTHIYEARYVSGVVAGMKLAELMEDGVVTADALPTAFNEDG